MTCHRLVNTILDAYILTAGKEKAGVSGTLDDFAKWIAKNDWATNINNRELFPPNLEGASSSMGGRRRSRRRI